MRRKEIRNIKYIGIQNLSLQIAKAREKNEIKKGLGIRVMVFNATFNIIQLYRGGQFY